MNFFMGTLHISRFNYRKYSLVCSQEWHDIMVHVLSTYLLYSVCVNSIWQSKLNNKYELILSTHTVSANHIVVQYNSVKLIVFKHQSIYNIKLRVNVWKLLPNIDTNLPNIVPFFKMWYMWDKKKILFGTWCMWNKKTIENTKGGFITCSENILKYYSKIIQIEKVIYLRACLYIR